MQLHIVGGFLGSGKTTAIVNALKLLLAEGRRVGVVTNDKGRHLVDTAFFASAAIPTVEVPGGCFRCNYGDFQERIAQLRAEARPDVIFAESVGSCVDLVGPVIQPLMALEGNGVEAVTYSVFADVRLLRRRLLDLPMPFNEDICYIFDTQLEEAGLIVVNKVDLLPAAEVEETLALLRARLPATAILPQCSLTPEGVAPWLATLHAEVAPPLGVALSVDYERYAAGAAQMAWLDETLTLSAAEGQARDAVLCLIDAVVAALRARDVPVAHLKFFVQGEGAHAKVSFLSLDASDWVEAIPLLPGDTAAVTINARVQIAPDALRELVHGALARALGAASISYQAKAPTAFAPRVPRPARQGA